MKTKWTAPEGGGAPLLTMPNIPHPLHGEGCQPRTIVGPTRWNQMRKECYEEHDDTCEICGQKLSGHRNYDTPLHNCHELFSYDYKTKTATFERLVCLCPKCHTGFIHSGRAITMYKNHTPLWTKEVMLDAAEHGFRLIHQWNKTHQKKLQCFEAFLDWMAEPSLEGEMRELVQRYDIEFYHVPPTNTADDWGKWKLVYDGTEYYSPYQSEEEWAEAMKTESEKRAEQNAQLFSGDEFEELRRNIKWVQLHS